MLKTDFDFGEATNNGVGTIWEANQTKAKGTTIYSVALQAGEDGENVLKACATDPAKGYYEIKANDNVEQKLETAFEAIAGSISIAASQGVVTIPWGRRWRWLLTALIRSLPAI